MTAKKTINKKTITVSTHETVSKPKRVLFEKDSAFAVRSTAPEVVTPPPVAPAPWTPPKSAFTVNYTEHRRGHASENKQAVIAAVTLGAAVAFLEGTGCVVNSAYSVLEGAAFIEV